MRRLLQRANVLDLTFLEPPLLAVTEFYLERAARLGLITERELQIRMEAAPAFVRGADVKSWRFRQAALQNVVVDGQ